MTCATRSATGRASIRTREARRAATRARTSATRRAAPTPIRPDRRGTTARAIVPSRTSSTRISERLEILDEVAPLPLGERQAEALLVVRHDLVERRGAAVVEVGPLQLRRVPETAQRCGAVELRRAA